MRTGRYILLAALPSFVVLAVLAAIAYRFAGSERAQQGWVVHTYRVIDLTRAVLADLADAETGQRGYLLTRQARYLGPYRTGIHAVGNHLTQLQALTVDNPTQQKRIQHMRPLVQKRLEMLDRGIMASGLSMAPSPTQMLSIMDQGKQAMDGVRADTAAALAEEQRLLDERTRATRVSENLMVETAVAATAVALVVFLIALLALLRNNRDLYRSEKQRGRQAAILQTTLDSIREGLVAFDADNTLRAFNDNFFRHTGFPKNLAHAGTTLQEFRDTPPGNGALAAFLSVPEEGPKYDQIELGSRTLEIYRDLIPDGGLLIACLDVTGRVRNEAALRQSQKMEAVGQLTGGIAHDFNNLLQIVGANLDLLMGEVRGNARAAERLQNATAAVGRGSRLTAQLLAFARRQALEPRSVNVGRLVLDMTDLLRRTIGERVETESSIAGGLWNTLIDPHQVENAVLNLAINARDAMPEGGKLTLEVANA
ncbi:MAG TPA: CHASE3 domain-containing protein, partial [Rhizomicrobium sp.]|nr:CHASE3 domain-containing protein [Rhizomicrobium sp.]